MRLIANILFLWCVAQFIPTLNGCGIFFDFSLDMKKIIQKTIQSSACDMAILFLRIFIGGVMLLHIIGKLQDYNNVVLNFRSILDLSAATSFALTVLFEGLFAAMIIMGAGTRLASIMMVLVSAIAVADAFLAGQITADGAKLEFVYMGIFLTLTISGGGKYAISRMIIADKNVQKH